MKQIRFLNADGWELGNGILSVVALPAHGGKIASIKYVNADFECLFQNPKPGFETAALGADFSKYEACGFDDAFPSVDRCEVEVGETRVEYPDHGEIWSARFSAEPDGDALILRYESPLLGYQYQKRLELAGNALQIDYRIRNVSDHDFPALWLCHCLMRMEPDMQLLMPDEVTSVRSAFNSDWLGQRGNKLNYPLDEGPRGRIDLSRMPSDGAYKFYVDDPLQSGWCGYRYPSSQVDVMIHYDAKALPYLGFWVTSGRYRGDYNCALEPTNGYYDSIPAAQRNGKCPVLHVGEEWNFSLKISVSEME